MLNNNHPLIYTIIVTYNGDQYIRKCLKLLAESSLPTQTIVVDNASSDNTVNTILNEFSFVELLKNAENKGFGMANNMAIQIALQRNADYVFLLNQDAFVQKDTLEKAVILSGKYPEYGIIGPVQLDGEGAALDERFKKYLGRFLSADELLKTGRQEYNSIEIIPVRFVNAAAWLLPSAVVKKVGMFHPLFFHYGEDNNYSARVQFHGYKVGVALNAFVFHERHFNINKQKELLRKIKTIIRYTSTDPRKNFGAAYLEAWYNYFTLWNKARSNLAFYRDALKKEKFFLLNLSGLKELRAQMKQSFNAEQPI